tara:strand:- start:116 stop:424 length:309 start_codon:yes stop_codon:yes gene_type:complete
MNNKGNIRDELWEEGVTTPDEFRLRLYFYGYLNKVGKGSLEHMNFKDEVVCKVEEIQDASPRYMNIGSGGGGDIQIESFGWEVGYDREMINYLNKGVAGLKI